MRKDQNYLVYLMYLFYRNKIEYPLFSSRESEKTTAHNHMGQTSQIHKLSSACDLMFCSHHLEILNFWTRGLQLCSPDSTVGKESTCNVGGLGSIPRLGRFPGEGEGYPLQHSGLENSMDCRVHGVAKSRTQLSNFHFHFHLHIKRPIIIQIKKRHQDCHMT